MVPEEELRIPREPAQIWKELREKLKQINTKNFFAISKNAEACAMDIQRLQHEFAESKKFHISMLPEPGKLILLKL